MTDMTREEIRRVRAEHKRREEAAKRDEERVEAPAPAPERQGVVVVGNPVDESGKVFDLSGNWMQRRAQVRDVLDLDKPPKSKAEAVELLTQAGYEVEGFDGA